MNGQEPQNYPSRAQDARLGLYWLEVAMNVWAMSLEVFTRTRFGIQYIGFRSVLVYPLVLLFAMVMGHLDPTGLLIFMLLFLFRSGWLQWAARIREWRGRERLHSWYGGRPYLMRWMPNTDEAAIKRFYEPCLLILIGVLLLPISPALGFYVFFGSLAVSGTITLIEFEERRRMRRLRDSVIEQRRLSEMLNR